MDDFIIMDSDLKKLKKTRDIIVEILDKEYKLKVNKKKTKIVSCKDGFSFLGYIYKVIDNKLIIKIKKSNLEKVKRRIKEVRYLLDKEKISYYQAFCSVMTYSNCYKYTENIRILKLIDRYFYNEK